MHMYSKGSDKQEAPKESASVVQSQLGRHESRYCILPHRILDDGVINPDVESIWDLLATHLKSIYDKHIPTKLTSTRHNIPWHTPAVRKMCRK